MLWAEEATEDETAETVAKLIAPYWPSPGSLVYSEALKEGRLAALSTSVQARSEYIDLICALLKYT